MLTLTALEAGGVIGPLSDYPSLDMRVEITLYDDGLFWMDYYNKGQQSDSIGAWEQTKNGYELYLDSGATWSLTLGSHGYYALPAGNVNMLFQASGAAGSAGQSAVDPALAPANIAAFSAPFKGDADDHVDAVDYVVSLLDNTTVAWEDDAPVSDTIGCARFVVNGGSPIQIIYGRSDGVVPAYTCRVEYAARDSLSARVKKCMDDTWMHVPALAAMLIDANYDEKAFLNRLYSFDTDKQNAAMEQALRQAFAGGAATVDYFGYKLTAMDETATHTMWLVLHRTAGGSVVPQLTARISAPSAAPPGRRTSARSAAPNTTRTTSRISAQNAATS